MPYARIDIRGYVVFLTPEQAKNAQKQGWEYLKIESMLIPGVLYLNAPGYTNVHGPKMRVTVCDPLEKGILTRVNDAYHANNTVIIEELKNHWDWKVPVPPQHFMSITIWGHYLEGLNMVLMREPDVVPMPSPKPRAQEQFFVRDPEAVLSSVGMNPRAEAFTPTQTPTPSIPSPVQFAPANPSPVVQQLVSTSTPPPMVGNYPAVMGMGLKQPTQVPDGIRNIWEPKAVPATPIFAPIPVVKTPILEQVVVQQPEPQQRKKMGERFPLKENNHRRYGGNVHA